MTAVVDLSQMHTTEVGHEIGFCWCGGHHTEKQSTRAFQTGATRDDDSQKLDYEGFLSPIVLRRFSEYMHKCRLRNIPVGQSIRSSDNWQNGMPLDSYMKSGLRHVFEWWLMHDGFVAKDEKGQVLDLEEVLCATLFNVQGYLFQILKAKDDRRLSDVGPGGSPDGCSTERPMPELPQSPRFDAQI